VHGGRDALGGRAASTRANYTGGWQVVFVQRYGAWCSVGKQA